MQKDSWNPPQYEKFKAERAQPFYDLMSLLEPAPDARLIDLGCGTGELTSELHHYMKAKESFGVDSSEQMLANAKTFESDSLMFAKADIQKWEEPQSFDIIFSNAAIQWCKDHPQIFQRLKNSLKENGQLAIQMPMNQDYATHTTAQQLGLEEPWVSLLKNPYDQHQVMLSAEEYAHWLFKLGFREQKVFVRVYGHVLESREGVIEWVKGTLLTRFQSQLSEQDYERFLTEFKSRLFKKLSDEKPFFYPFKRILIWAKA